jgi:membrane protease YdiL (CAAX protease family)
MSAYIILTIKSPEFDHFRLWHKPKNWLIQIAVILSGSLIGYAAYLIVPPSVSNQNQPVGALIFSSVILIGALGFVEEIVFRGILLDGVAQQLDEFSSIIYVSILYAVLSMQTGQLLLVGFAFIVSVYYAIVVRKANSLYGVIGAHSIAAVVYYVLGPYFLS